ncbi:hypothetical protein Y048_5374 [Burkholderia pseudomallei MSHR456]|nr:hypothetical protein Y048_5374 [Burkholderia pseudomallei MSHR456]
MGVAWRGGRWSLVAGRWSLVGGRRSAVGSRWSVVGGRWSHRHMRIDVALHRSTRMPFAPPAPRMPAPTTHRGTARPHIRQRRRTQPTMAPPDAQPPAPGERGRFQVSSRIPENHVSQWRSSAFASVAGRPRAAT